MTLLTPLKNDKSAHTEPSVMRHPASRHKSSSPITVPFKRTIIRPALLLILLIFSASHVLADKFVCTVGGISYSVNTTNKTASVVSNYYGAYSGNIIIPETIIYDNTTYSVTSIGEDAFYGCSGLTSAIIGNSVKSIGESAFDSCSGLTSVTIGNSVKSIGEGAFRYCSGLTSVTIPNSVTFIGEDAFSDCSGLTSVTIPNAVISIGYGAFSDCSGLTSVTIGNSVTSIGEIAFYGCSGLTKLVSLAIEPPVCGYQVFEGVDKTACRLLVPEESINKYKTADKWEEFLYISYNGVDDVSVDTQDAVYEVYNLQGVRVGSGMREAEVTADALPHCVYILLSPQGRKKIQI